MVRDGYFGFQDYFESLCDKVEGGNDFYLLGYDFQSYLEAQVIFCSIEIPKSQAFWCSTTWNGSKNPMLTLFNCRLLLIKHLLIKRSGLGWASLALLGLEDLAVIEQLKNMRRRLGESNPADVHSNQNLEVLCRRYISCGYPNDLAATVLMPWSKPVLLLPEDETTLAFNLDNSSSHTFPATILTAHRKKTLCLIRSAIITQ